MVAVSVTVLVGVAVIVFVKVTVIVEVGVGVLVGVDVIVSVEVLVTVLVAVIVGVPAGVIIITYAMPVSPLESMAKLYIAIGVTDGVGVGTEHGSRPVLGSSVPPASSHSISSTPPLYKAI